MSPKLTERLFWISGWIYDFSKLATALLLVGLFFHFFVYTALVVRGESMVPNFSDGQVLAVSKVAYRLQSPERGDVVAMSWPGETQKRFIKRIVGLPGEAVVIDQGLVFINGSAIAEDYLPPGTTTSSNLTRILQDDEYFVLGDNRAVSSDSRAWGPVPRNFLIGKVGRELVKLHSSN